MSSNKNNFNFEHLKNSDYGDGIFRRHVLLKYSEQHIYAALEDDVHAFSAEIFHHKNHISQIDAQAIRYPFTTCESADQPLKEFVGKSLQLSTRDYAQQVSPTNNCTHLYDLILAALFHYSHLMPEKEAASDNKSKQLPKQLNKQKTRRVIYEIAVTDQQTQRPSVATIDINGQRIHSWEVKDWQVCSPQEIAQQPLLKGFGAWATHAFDGLEKQAAFMLQKGIFVSQARRYSIDKLIGTRASDERSAQNVCHTYSPQNAQHAIRINNPLQDFTNAKQQVLKFADK